MSAQLRTRAGGRRLAGVLLIPLLLVVAGCSTAAGTPAPASANTSAAPRSSEPASGALGAPAQAPGSATVGSTRSGGAEVFVTGVGTSGGGVAGSNPAIAYPYPAYPGSPGLAPDHTIVVTGIGRADVRADLSDRSSAQRGALESALADARAQADIVARAAGVTITGVLSVSVSSGEAYAMPMTAGAEGSAPGATQGGAPNIVPMPPVEPTTQQLVVSVTVAYRIS